MEAVRQLIEDWVEQGFIPGASLRVLHKGRVWFSCDAGYTDCRKSQPVSPDTLYDLASLTKVTATLPTLLLLMQEGKLRLDDTLDRHFPDCPADKRSITVLQLLTHTSGLPADVAERRRDARLELPALVYGHALLHPPGERVVYSDLGMIWLGLLVEKLAGVPLDAYAEKCVFTPLGMNATCYRPDPARFPRIAATEYCERNRNWLVGEVHDEKAFAMGGVAGHAGLFSTAGDLCRYASFWLYGQPSLLAPEWRELATRCWTQGLNDARGLGWEINASGDVKSCGTLFSQAGFGHTGFTGTSMWLDPRRDVAIIFLTNAVHLGRNNPIRKLRPILHDAIMTRLTGFDK
jgi:CubicO group peptidase (beta-lactamase class C family)